MSWTRCPGIDGNSHDNFLMILFDSDCVAELLLTVKGWNKSLAQMFIKAKAYSSMGET